MLVASNDCQEGWLLLEVTSLVAWGAAAGLEPPAAQK